MDSSAAAMDAAAAATAACGLSFCFAAAAATAMDSAADSAANPVQKSFFSSPERTESVQCTCSVFFFQYKGSFAAALFCQRKPPAPSFSFNIKDPLLLRYFASTNCPTSSSKIVAWADNSSLVAEASSAVAALLCTTSEI